MKKHILTLVSILFLALGIQAQESKKKNADKEFDNLSYIDARQAYIKVAESGYKDADLLKKLGDSYYYTADYKEASKWYKMLYNMGNREPEYLYRYALTLKSKELYSESDVVMEELIKVKGEDFRSQLFLQERNYLAEIEAQSGRFDLARVGFNSNLSDFAPAFYQDNIVFASNRASRGFMKLIHDWNDQPFLDIYKAVNADPLKENEKGKDLSEKFSKSINSKFHESTAVFTKDEQTVYFTRNNFTDKKIKRDSKGINLLKLYRGKLSEKGKWEVTELPFNSDEYSVAHPALSTDGNTLYFASDMPGGKGKSDLYKVAIEGDGFGEITNLGDAINTEGRETFPFISPENELFFASTGHVGLGGLDVFVSDLKEDGTYGAAYNLGRPINSPQDDFTFIVESNGLGYFASNRPGGSGDDDIYSFKITKKLIKNCTKELKGQVKDITSAKAIPEANVYLLDKEGNIIEKVVSDKDGNFSFEADLVCNRFYSIRSQKENYGTADSYFTTEGSTGVVERDLLMGYGPGMTDLGTPVLAESGADLVKILGLNPIYFDLDKSFIRPDAEIELRKVIAIMKLYPSMKIDVRSHTDSRANDAYNMSLSDRRAKSTMKYIIERGGIDASRLTGRGYGETQPVNRCTNGAKCTNYEFERNRRSEFIIL